MIRILCTALLLSLPSTSMAHEAHHKAAGNKKGSAHSPEAPKPPKQPLPPFSLTDQNGTPVTRDTFKGKILIVDFIYTLCGDECPLMTMRMKTLQTKLNNTSGVTFVTVTTDPTHDTPAVLKTYAQNYKATEANWFFLTGDKKVIVDLSVKGLNLTAEETSVNHTEYFALVNANGLVEGYYDSTKPKQLEKLERDVRLLAKKMAK